MPTYYNTLDELDQTIRELVERDFPELFKQGIVPTGVLKMSIKGGKDKEETVPCMNPPAVLKKRSPLYAVWDVPAYYIVLDFFVWEHAPKEVTGWLGNALSATRKRKVHDAQITEIARQIAISNPMVRESSD